MPVVCLVNDCVPMVYMRMLYLLQTFAGQIPAAISFLRDKPPQGEKPQDSSPLQQTCAGRKSHGRKNTFHPYRSLSGRVWGFIFCLKERLSCNAVVSHLQAPAGRKAAGFLSSAADMRRAKSHGRKNTFHPYRFLFRGGPGEIFFFS